MRQNLQNTKLTLCCFYPHNGITMHRFFLPPECFGHDGITLPLEVVHQIIRVLRLKTGDRIIALDNSGFEYEAELISLEKDTASAAVIQKRRGKGEPEIEVTLYQSLLKADKFEFVLQKCVELGVSTFVPVLSERSVAGKPSANRLERWRKIIKEAAEQSGRSCLPDLMPTATFVEACSNASDPGIMLWEGEISTGLSQVLSQNKFRGTSHLSIFIGPEGSFSPNEIDLAKKMGLVTVSLGQRILRAETAGMAAVSVIIYALGGFTV